MIKLKTVWIFGLIMILLFSLTCQMQPPNAPEGSSKVILNLEIVKSGIACNPSRGIKQNTVAKPTNIETIDEVKIVFYDFEVDLQTIVQQYNSKWSELNSLYINFPGEVTDFEGYWIARDQAEFNIISAGNYWLEKRVDLSVSGGRASGEIELEEGSKTFTVGCFENGRLIYVGYPPVDNSGFFFNRGGENDTIGVRLFQVSVTVNNNPNAVFTIMPTVGTVDTVFTFDASQCWDVEDATALLEVRWDWETDGIWDTGYSTDKIAIHQYGADGSYTVTLEVKDTEGLTDQTTQIVTVTSTGDMISLEWVTVTGGTFQMGDTFGDGSYDELPVHSVTLSSFQISKYEVTNAQYSVFLNVYGSSTVKSGDYTGQTMVYEYQWGIQESGGTWQAASGYENYPVVYVTWYGAYEFCRYYGYWLPTEAEWEYAARGGNQSQGYKYSGSNNLEDVAWYDDNSDGSTHTVGTKAANELGIHDMSGNVWEWCNDWYDSGYYNQSPQNNPQGPSSGVYRLLRGGSWYSEPNHTRCSERGTSTPGIWYYGFGFRCTRAL